MYRLARPRARCYQLRGLPLVGSECACPQCNSLFVITRGSDMSSAMSSAMDLPVPFVSQDLKSSQETAIATIELPDKMYPAILCTVKCPMVRPQRYTILQKPLSGYQPQVGSNRAALINIAVRTMGNGQVQHIPVSFTTTQDLPR